MSGTSAWQHPEHLSAHFLFSRLSVASLTVGHSCMSIRPQFTSLCSCYVTPVQCDAGLRRTIAVLSAFHNGSLLTSTTVATMTCIMIGPCCNLTNVFHGTEGMGAWWTGGSRAQTHGGQATPVCCRLNGIDSTYIVDSSSTTDSICIDNSIDLSYAVVNWSFDAQRLHIPHPEHSPPWLSLSHQPGFQHPFLWIRSPSKPCDCKYVDGCIVQGAAESHFMHSSGAIRTEASVTHFGR